MNIHRLSWDEYGLALAVTVAQRSACTRRQVGAVILGPDHRVKGAGYNGAPAGDNRDCPRESSTCAAYSDYSNCIALHAEANALLYSDHRGGTIYITDKPCDGCDKLIRGSGLVRAVWPGGGYALEKG